MALWGEAMSGAWTGSLLPNRYSQRIKRQTGISKSLVLILDLLQVQSALFLYRHYAVAAKSARLLRSMKTVYAVAYLVPVASRTILYLHDKGYKKKLKEKPNGTVPKAFWYSKFLAFDESIGTACQVAGLASSVGLMFHKNLMMGGISAAFISHGFLYRNSGRVDNSHWIMKKIGLGRMAVESMGWVAFAGMLSANAGRLLSGQRRLQLLAIGELVAKVVSALWKTPKDQSIWEGHVGDAAEIVPGDWERSEEEFRVNREHAVYAPPQYPKMVMSEVRFDYVIEQFDALISKDGDEYDTLLVNRVEGEDACQGRYLTRADKWNFVRKGLQTAINRITQDGDLIFRDSKQYKRNPVASNIGAFVIHSLQAVEMDEPNKRILADCLIRLGIVGHMCGDPFEDHLMEMDRRFGLSAMAASQDEGKAVGELAKKKLYNAIYGTLLVERDLCFKEQVSEVYKNLTWLQYLYDRQDIHLEDGLRKLFHKHLGIEAPSSRVKEFVSIINQMENIYTAYAAASDIEKFWSSYSSERIVQAMFVFFKANTGSWQWVRDWFNASYKIDRTKGKEALEQQYAERRELWKKICLSELVVKSDESVQAKEVRVTKLAAVTRFRQEISMLSMKLRGGEYLKSNPAAKLKILEDGIAGIEKKGRVRADAANAIEQATQTPEGIKQAIASIKEKYPADWLLGMQLDPILEILNGKKSDGAAKMKRIQAKVAGLKVEAGDAPKFADAVRKGVEDYKKRREDELKNGTIFPEIRTAIDSVLARTSDKTKKQLLLLQILLGKKPVPADQVSQKLESMRAIAEKLPEEWKDRLQICMRLFVEERPENQPTDFAEIKAVIKSAKSKDTKQIETVLGKEKCRAEDIPAKLALVESLSANLPDEIKVSFNEAMAEEPAKFDEIKAQVAQIFGEIKEVAPHREAIAKLTENLAKCPVGQLAKSPVGQIDERLGKVTKAIGKFPKKWKEAIEDGIGSFQKDFKEIQSAIKGVLDGIQLESNKSPAPPERVHVSTWISRQGIRLLLWKFAKGAIIAPTKPVIPEAPPLELRV